jgi:5-hydroxyisourate hydrolase
MSPLTTHVLDIETGKPARGVAVTLAIARDPGHWVELAHGVTDADGRIAGFVPALEVLEVKSYRLRFATGPYFKALDVDAFYPEVDVIFQIHNPAEHYHLALLLSPFGYGTYRGS